MVEVIPAPKNIMRQLRGDSERISLTILALLLRLLLEKLIRRLCNPFYSQNSTYQNHPATIKRQLPLQLFGRFADILKILTESADLSILSESSLQTYWDCTL